MSPKTLMNGSSSGEYLYQYQIDIIQLFLEEAVVMDYNKMKQFQYFFLYYMEKFT